MKKLFWFTHTNIDTRKVSNFHVVKKEEPKIVIDLTDFIDIFKQNKIWERKKYRTEYIRDYNLEDLSRIKSIKINLHSENTLYSNGHLYETVIEKYIDLSILETSKITSSGIGEATQIAVLEIEFDSEHKVIDYLTHEEEKNFEIVFEKKLSPENIDSWYELSKIKSIACEFLQFYCFNLHLNFLTTDYSFSFTDKPLQTGFTAVTDFNNCYYETDKINFLSHYIYYEVDKDIMLELMNKTSKFWHKEIPSIHFFLNALQGTYITIDNFSKLVFTLESFYGKMTSTDFITLTIPLLISDEIHTMKKIREVLKQSFTIRNNHVHGGKIINLNSSISESKSNSVDHIFYELKNIIIYTFHFHINDDLYLSKMNEKINHDLLFRLLSKAVKAKTTNS